MPDYTDQLQQERAKEQQKIIRMKRPSIEPAVEITDAEWMLIGSVALIGDSLGPFGFPCVFILLLWYIMRFHRFPTGKIIGAGLAEAVTFGLAPGWIGFVLITFLKQKGYLPKWAMGWIK